MWCERCRRDYEPVLSDETGGAACPQCGQPGPVNGETLGDPERDPIRLFENLQDEVLVGTQPAAFVGAKSEVLRIDGAHPLALVPVETGASDDEPRPGGTRSGRPRRSAGGGAARFLGTAFGYLGVLGLAIGAGLLWYGLSENRPELEQPGWLTVMFGQIGLLFGWAALVWSGSRTAKPEASRELAYLHERLSALESNRAAENPYAPSFYHHLAAGAPVQLLLAELRGQLALLATRLGQQHRAQP